MLFKKKINDYETNKTIQQQNLFNIENYHKFAYLGS